MLRSLEFGPNDAANVIPDEAEFERRTKESLAKQDARRTRIEDELKRTHGHNAIRPFFVLSEPVYNSELGQWLIRLMNLMPYDDWNIVYLPMDRETQAAMGGLPLHPRQSIGPIDELMCEQIGSFYSEFKDAKRKVDLHVREVGLSAAQGRTGSLRDLCRCYAAENPRSRRPRSTDDRRAHRRCSAQSAARAGLGTRATARRAQ